MLKETKKKLKSPFLPEPLRLAKEHNQIRIYNLRIAEVYNEISEIFNKPFKDPKAWCWSTVHSVSNPNKIKFSGIIINPKTIRMSFFDSLLTAMRLIIQIKQL